MFSRRVPGTLTPNRLATRVAELRARGTPILDLTVTNPTLVGIPYPPGVLDAFASAAAQTYTPHPLGSIDARQAVAADYQRRGIEVPIERIALTASTSEAYAFLFKLLCDPGDELLVPQPSYPLFEHLTRLEAVTPVSYPLVYTGRWEIDRVAIEQRLSPRTRAILVVSPNNPTGSLLTPDEARWLVAWCAARSQALILDEVFADYVMDDSATTRPHPVLAQAEALTFSLGGLSKTVGLPHLKLAWLAAAGPPPVVRQALSRLEVIGDTYLSVSMPVQSALPRLLADGAAVRDAIRARLHRNLTTLTARAAAAPMCSVLPVEGGWSALVRVPATRAEETLVLDLLEAQVLVHPGFFYELPCEAFLVISLLPPEEAFDDACRRLFHTIVTVL